MQMHWAPWIPWVLEAMGPVVPHPLWQFTKLFKNCSNAMHLILQGVGAGVVPANATTCAKLLSIPWQRSISLSVMRRPRLVTQKPFGRDLVMHIVRSFVTVQNEGEESQSIT
jgi:hypothetical protein